MIYLSIAITCLLAVFACLPHLRVLQLAHYRPWPRLTAGQSIIQVCLSVYAAAVTVVWPWLLPAPAWQALCLAVAYLPLAVWLVCSIPRVHLVLTHRLMRLVALIVLIYAALAIVTSLVHRHTLWGLGAALPYVLCQVAAGILYPIESARNRRFVRRMHDKWLSSGVCTVGITGSAGKTTVKRLLTAALGEGAYATPGNFNTPMGLALSIRDMPPHTRWFVAEMGVGKPDDMVELLDVVRPDVGVVTCVLPQHTAHFASVQQIRQEKCRLLQCVPWGLCHTSVGYAAHTYGEGGEWWAENVRILREGTVFDACHGALRIHVELPILGRQTVDNALAALAVATHLGISTQSVLDAWRHVSPEPHRMQVSHTPHGVTIVDDSYNCNILGAQYALEYLRLYEGRRVVATSGIEEADPDLGLNRALGGLIADTADVVVVVGDRHLDELRQGLGDRVELHVVPDTRASAALYARLLTSGDVLLIMADYPV